MKLITISSQEGDVVPEVTVQTIFEQITAMAVKFTFGTAKIPAGMRVPPEGTGSHAGDEYSIILKGEIMSGSGGEECRVKSGQASFIPAGEAHWAMNDSDIDCELVWVMLEDVSGQD